LLENYKNRNQKWFEYRFGDYYPYLIKGCKGEWVGLKKWHHWQKYKIGKLEEGKSESRKIIRFMFSSALMFFI